MKNYAIIPLRALRERPALMRRLVQRDLRQLRRLPDGRVVVKWMARNGKPEGFGRVRVYTNAEVREVLAELDPDQMGGTP